MVSDKILMLIGKFQAFRIRCIMLILDKLLNYSGFKNIIPTSSFSKLLGIELVVCS
jgi:hypothetical protein